MLVDLTLKLNKDNEAYKWAISQENPLAALGHVGTHLDSYLQTTIPLEYFKNNGILFNVKGKNLITSEDIDLDKVKKDDFVLFYSDYSNLYNYGSDEYFQNHPQLSDELINKLIDKKIRFLGLDFAGIKNDKTHVDFDKLLEKNNIYVIENLINLNKINTDSFNVYVFWLEENDSTGLKCRVIVETY